MELALNKSTKREIMVSLGDSIAGRTDGTGVRLALVNRVVEVHTGRVSVESDCEGHGPVFFVTFEGA